jgi:hypothetical protein
MQQAHMRRFQPHARGPAPSARLAVVLHQGEAQRRAEDQRDTAAQSADHAVADATPLDAAGASATSQAAQEAPDTSHEDQETVTGAGMSLGNAAPEVARSHLHPLGHQERQQLEEQEWAQRRAEIERQREEARAAREAKRRAQQAACVAEARDAAAAVAARQQRMRQETRQWLAALLPQRMTVRSALAALSFTVPPGESGLRSAMRRARAFYHPDAACRRRLSEKELIKCEEIFKLLGTLPQDG